MKNVYQLNNEKIIIFGIIGLKKIHETEIWTSNPIKRLNELDHVIIKVKMICVNNNECDVCFRPTALGGEGTRLRLHPGDTSGIKLKVMLGGCFHFIVFFYNWMSVFLLFFVFRICNLWFLRAACSAWDETDFSKELKTEWKQLKL